MLILTRQEGESIMVGEEIKVTVTKIDRRFGAVKIGIEAPKSVPVFREELYQAIKAEGRELPTPAERE